MYIPVGGEHAEVLELEMRDVYADVIEGVPNASINNDIVRSAVERARRLDANAYLVPPISRSLGVHGGEAKESLPRIACVARVRGVACDDSADFAEAVIVWFQAKVSTAIDSEVAAVLARVKWAEIAHDVFW